MKDYLICFGDQNLVSGLLWPIWYPCPRRDGRCMVVIIVATSMKKKSCLCDFWWRHSLLYDWRKMGKRREIFYKDTLFQGSLIRWKRGNSAMETLRFIQTPPVSTRLGLNSYRHASPWASLELYLLQSLKYGITSWVAPKIWNPTPHLIVDGKRKGHLQNICFPHEKTQDPGS